eukprot:3938370-Rhodomonas_salina.2
MITVSNTWYKLRAQISRHLKNQSSQFVWRLYSALGPYNSGQVRLRYGGDLPESKAPDLPAWDIARSARWGLRPPTWRVLDAWQR